MSIVIQRAIGAPISRLDGPAKVTGTAKYAFEHQVNRPAYLYPLQATIATGRVTGIHTDAALAEAGVLAILTSANAPKLIPGWLAELLLLQSAEISYRGQFIGGVIAETPEIARHAASLVRFDYEELAHDTKFHADRDDLHEPHVFIGAIEDHDQAQAAQSDIDAAFASAPFTVNATYTTASNYHNPMEPHATIAIWTNDELTLYCGSQGVFMTRAMLAPLFGLDPQRIRIISPYVGGAFGAKTFPTPDMVLTVMAAQLVAGRAVKMALTRQQMFSQVGYRTPTIQHIRLAAGADGRLTAIEHEALEQSAKVREWAENSTRATRKMYAASLQRTVQQIASLDVPVPTFMRGPGEAPGMFALESAMDELAVASGIDPIELHIRNETDVDPVSGHPFSSRHLVTCMREGARLFGWYPRDQTPRIRREQQWLIGTGMSAAIFHMPRFLGENSTTIRVNSDGHYSVHIAAADLGTGTWTTLAQIAADTLEVPMEQVELQIGDTDLPEASPGGGSAGLSHWGAAVVDAANKMRALLSAYGGIVPAEGLEVTGKRPANPYYEQFALYSFGAQFAEVRVHELTGEVRVSRLLGMFDAGRIINPKTARSQFIGGMTMGLSMALHEHGVLDPQFGHVVNHDFAGYHIATNADVGSIEAHWLDEEDLRFNPMGAKGIGEICIVGTAAAIANAVYHATGIRVRDLPITLDKLLQ
ncbi:MAG TPA: xanthine dehydrogenase family protein molybdopterin-binding subunit [Ktedonobacteraceae bacterium]|nr:xanthine dehydrogenase family protein molybdopterin-binding subunit [Ktedonobacteraceae bacterium]